MTTESDPLAELRGYYDGLETEEIIATLRRGGLRPEAEEIARNELIGRGLGIESFPSSSPSIGGEVDPANGERLARLLYRSALVRAFILGGAIWAVLVAKGLLGVFGIGIGLIPVALCVAAGAAIFLWLAKSICGSKESSYRDKKVTLWSLLIGGYALYYVVSFVTSSRR